MNGSRNAVSLFSGIGGLDLGLELAGWNIMIQCEKDEYRREVLRERFGQRTTVEDVSKIYYGKSKSGNPFSGFYTIDERGRETWTGISSRTDLLCGGFPCQDLSVAGKRAGLAGERSGLFFEFARIADESVRDGGFILLENVPGLYSSNEGNDFRIILETLSECGFNDIAWRTLNSQYFGVPQRRRRIIILGRRSRGRSCAKILLEPESGERNFKTSNSKEQNIAKPLGSGIRKGGAGYRNDLDNETYVAFHLKQDPISSEISPALGTTTKGMGISGPLTKRYGKGINSTMDDGAAIVETTGVRRLTPVECERLQGFPDNWTLVNNASDTKRYAAIGDAVTVPVAAWIGRRILKYG
jgi:DNA (cytosine-5)-methyltransferase 1